MTPIPGTEGHPPWLQLVGALSFVIMLGILSAVSTWWGRRQTAKDAQTKKTETETAARQAGTMIAIQKTAAGLHEDALLTAIGALTGAVNRLNAHLEEQEQERDVEKAAEEKLMRQQIRDLVRSGKLTLTPKE